MDYNGAGLTYRRPQAAGWRRPRGAGLTYRRPHGAGAMDPVITPLAEGEYAAAAMGVASVALYGLFQYFIIKYAIRGAKKR